MMKSKKVDFEDFLGIDLSGTPKNPSGIAKVKNFKIVTKLAYHDEEILEEGKAHKFIYIDAPLSLPGGRSSIEEKNEHHFRECDLKLRILGIRFFPVTLGGMRKLTQRGILLREELIKEGKEVFEVFPGAFYDVFGVKRKDKRVILSFYLQFLEKFGLTLEKKSFTQDELDAIACLLTGILHRLGKGEELSGEDGCIIIPKKI